VDVKQFGNNGENLPVNIYIFICIFLFPDFARWCPYGVRIRKSGLQSHFIRMLFTDETTRILIRTTRRVQTLFNLFLFIRIRLCGYWYGDMEKRPYMTVVVVPLCPPPLMPSLAPRTQVASSQADPRSPRPAYTRMQAAWTIVLI